MTAYILGIIGVVLSILTTIALSFLSSIRSSQEKIVIEIKEMNNDMRSVLSRMSANDVRFETMHQRMDSIEAYVEEVDTRVHHIEISR